MVTITCDPADDSGIENPCTCIDGDEDPEAGDCSKLPDLTSSNFSSINCESLCAGFNTEVEGISAQCEYYKQIEVIFILICSQ